MGSSEGAGVRLDYTQPDEVRRKADAIVANGDPEGAHVDEDDLLGQIIREIADEHPEPEALAQAVLPLLDADRTRWYA